MTMCGVLAFMPLIQEPKICRDGEVKINLGFF